MSNLLHDNADMVHVQVVTHTQEQLDVLMANTSEHVDVSYHTGSQL